MGTAFIRPSRFVALPSYFYGESQVDATNLTTYSFSNIVTNATKTPYLCVIGGYATSTGAQTFSSATIDGETADLVEEILLNSTTDPLAFMIQAVVSDTTPDLSLTFTGTMSRCGIRAWALHDLTSNTAADTGSDTGADPTLDHDTQVGGVSLAVAGQVSTSAITWIGLTEDEAKETIDGTVEFSSASALIASASTPLTITADFVSSSFNAGVSAHWR